MPAIAKERPLGRRATRKSGEREYVIRDALSEADAIEALLAAAPPALDGNPRVDEDCEVEELDGREGFVLYLGVAKYASVDAQFSPPEGTTSIAFDVTGQTQRITQSRATVSHHVPPGKVSIAFDGAINSTADGVEGTDVLVPGVAFEFSRTFPADHFADGTYIRTLIATVGAVNTDAWQGLQAGEALLTQVTGERRTDGKWALRFKVAVSLNETDLPIGPITVTAKKGWEYVWVHYEPTASTGGDATSVVRTPRQAIVCEIYRKVEYSALGI